MMMIMMVIMSRYKEEGVKTVKKYRAKFNLRPAGENFEPAERRQQLKKLFLKLFILRRFLSRKQKVWLV